jgi:hypothetical protein
VTRRRTRGPGRLRWLGVCLGILVSGCAGLRNSPEQETAYERWRACAPPSAVVEIQRIDLDGRIWFWYVVEPERRDVLECLGKAGRGGPSLPEPVGVLRPRGGA